MAYSQYVPKHERPVITMLIQEALARGYRVTVNDGVEDVLKDSLSLRAVQKELGSTGEDWVSFYSPLLQRVGAFYLIYNNGSEGDPMIVIADHIDNALCNEIYDKISAKYNTY